MKLYRNNAISIIKKFKDEVGDSFKIEEENGSYGITGSTFRAYRDFKQSPSKVFRTWATKQIESDDIFKSLKKIKNKDDFNKFHKELSNSLDKFWLDEQNKKLEFHQNNKILDLFVKFLAYTNKTTEFNVKDTILNFGNIPLDKFSLLAVKELFFGIVISNNPSMGNITEEDTYQFLQNQISELMDDAGVPNLYFDIYAWNRTHQK